MIILSKLSNLKKNNFLPSLKYTHIFMTTKYMSTSPMEPSLSSIPQEQFQPLVALFHCTCYSLQFWSAVPRVCLCKALYQGSAKGDIGAPLRKNLRVCGLQNMNTMSFTFQKSHFPKMFVIWKLPKLPRFLYCILISMSGKKQVTAAALCYPTQHCSFLLFSRN